jgi:hypothetical protein
MKTILLIILIIMSAKMLRGQDTNVDFNIHKVWVYLNNDTKMISGYLYEIRDSSILISGNKLTSDYLIEEFEVNNEIVYSDIKIIKIRKQKRIYPIVIATVLGIAAGVAIGFVSGDDPESISMLRNFTAKDKALITGVGFGFLGGVIASVSWAEKIKIEIEEKYENFEKHKQFLRSRAIVN